MSCNIAPHDGSSREQSPSHFELNPAHTTLDILNARNWNLPHLLFLYPNLTSGRLRRVPHDKSFPPKSCSRLLYISGPSGFLSLFRPSTTSQTIFTKRHTLWERVEHATVSLIPPSVSCSNNNAQDLDTRTFCPQSPLSREDELGWQEHVDGPLDWTQYSTAIVLDVDMGSVLNLGRLLEAVSSREDRCRVGLSCRTGALLFT